MGVSTTGMVIYSHACWKHCSDENLPFWVLVTLQGWKVRVSGIGDCMGGMPSFHVFVTLLR